VNDDNDDDEEENNNNNKLVLLLVFNPRDLYFLGAQKYYKIYQIIINAVIIRLRFMYIE